MKTSIIGYPRVGSLRELKFTTEKYFRGEISAEELQNTAKEIRKTQWTLQKNTGLDFIPSNDFSFYDMTLDREYYSILFQSATQSLDFLHWIPILPWQGGIREQPEMSRHLP